MAHDPADRWLSIWVPLKKTRVVHIDEGFDFLGWRIQRRRRRDQNGKPAVYTHPSKKALASVMAKVRSLTARAKHRTLGDLMRSLNRVQQGWCNYFRHGVSARTYHARNSPPPGVLASFSRPRVSDDNPYAEALFRTLKYRPGYPRKPSDSVDAARAWVAGFVAWYNGEHLHSSIRYVTPEERHQRLDATILAQRHHVYRAAFARTPRRWTGKTRNWTPIGAVSLNTTNAESRITH